jgi:hypothetical protein
MTAIKIPIHSTAIGTYKQKDLSYEGLSPFVLCLNGLHSNLLKPYSISLSLKAQAVA